MSEFEAEEAIARDSEDEQLKIRIPNPKVYMARQSLWIGRRGKPRVLIVTSATVYYLLVITVPGRLDGSANIRHFRHQRIVVYRGVTAVA
ncbi:hypothetical protein H0H92_008901 [Tricholoma furcatifolium]|nr:hypothetical protein H0H92_008901 [Tricholoma furcatifolium]